MGPSLDVCFLWYPCVSVFSVVTQNAPSKTYLPRYICILSPLTLMTTGLSVRPSWHPPRHNYKKNSVSMSHNLSSHCPFIPSHWHSGRWSGDHSRKPWVASSHIPAWGRSGHSSRSAAGLSITLSGCVSSASSRGSASPRPSRSRPVCSMIYSGRRRGVYPRRYLFLRRFWDPVLRK